MRKPAGLVPILVLASLVTSCLARPAPSGAPAVSGPPPTAPTRSNAPDAPASPPPRATVQPADAWTLVALGSAAGVEQFRGIAAVPDGFVVVGSFGPAGEHALAMHSDDGRVWDNELIEDNEIAPDVVTQWNDGLIAVGSGSTNRCAHPFGMATWTRTSDGFWAGPGRDEDLCAGGNPSVVVFHGRPWLIGSGTGDVPYLMESEDGLSWANRRNRLGDDFNTVAGADADGMWIVARSPTDGSWIVLRSVGLGWGDDPLPGDVATDVLTAATVDGRLTILVVRHGAIGQLRSMADGRWDETPVDGLPLGSVRIALVQPGRIVAIGTRENGPSGLFVSRDGTGWRSVAQPGDAGPGSTFLDLAVGPDMAVLVGQVELPDGSAAVGAIWTAPSSILAP